MRHNVDAEHRELRRRWHGWRSEYRATLRCRKCGELFSITDKAERDRKRCGRCEALRVSMSKRSYGKLSFDKPLDPRQIMAKSGSKAAWDGLRDRNVVWVPGDSLYVAVVRSVETEEQAKPTMYRLGISYKVYRAICAHAFGAGYDAAVLSKRRELIEKNREQARTDSRLEGEFAENLERAGFKICARNSWMTLQIGQNKVKREADIKVAVGDGRKAIVLCDGEAFHGPGCLYAEPEARISSDRETAMAFFGLGYSVVRYSETEIHDGIAIDHFRDVMKRLASRQRVYRNWCPAEELEV